MDLHCSPRKTTDTTEPEAFPLRATSWWCGGASTHARGSDGRVTVVHCWGSALHPAGSLEACVGFSPFLRPRNFALDKCPRVSHGHPLLTTDDLCTRISLSRLHVVMQILCENVDDQGPSWVHSSRHAEQVRHGQRSWFALRCHTLAPALFPLVSLFLDSGRPCLHSNTTFTTIPTNKR